MSTLLFETYEPPHVSAYRRCEAMVLRYAPLLMRAGGGPIGEASALERMPAMSEDERKRIVELYGKGVSYRKIAEELKRRPGTVSVFLCKFRKRGDWRARKPGCPKTQQTGIVTLPKTDCFLETPQ